LSPEQGLVKEGARIEERLEELEGLRLELGAQAERLAQEKGALEQSRREFKAARFEAERARQAEIERLRAQVRREQEALSADRDRLEAGSFLNLVVD
jgi:chromosome segregation ATPase